MHKPAVPDRSQHERHRKVETEHTPVQVASGDSDGMARPERHVFEHPAIFTQRDFAFGAAIQIIENRFRQLPVSDRAEICDANHPRRRHTALGAGHRDIPMKHILIETRRSAPERLVADGGASQHYSPQVKSASMRRDWTGLEQANPSKCLCGDSRLRLRSEFVTFSKLPKIDAANQAATTTISSKIQKSRKLSGQALRCSVERSSTAFPGRGSVAATFSIKV